MRWYDENDEVDAEYAAELEAAELRLLTADEPTDDELEAVERSDRPEDMGDFGIGDW